VVLIAYLPSLSSSPCSYKKTTLKDGDGDAWVERNEVKALLINLFWFNKAFAAFEAVDTGDDRRVDLSEVRRSRARAGKVNGLRCAPCLLATHVPNTAVHSTHDDSSPPVHRRSGSSSLQRRPRQSLTASMPMAVAKSCLMNSVPGPRSVRWTFRVKNTLYHSRESSGRKREPLYSERTPLLPK
jgi:hypothetical protein